MRAKNLLGPVIKSLRKEHKMTQSDLAQKTGYKQNTISQHENQRRELSEKDLNRYASVFGVTPQDLYNRLNSSDMYIANLLKENNEVKEIAKEVESVVKSLDAKTAKDVLEYALFKMKQKNRS